MLYFLFPFQLRPFLYPVFLSSYLLIFPPSQPLNFLLTSHLPNLFPFFPNHSPVSFMHCSILNGAFHPSSRRIFELRMIYAGDNGINKFSTYIKLRRLLILDRGSGIARSSNAGRVRKFLSF